jgi:hypothetical protein
VSSFKNYKEGDFVCLNYKKQQKYFLILNVGIGGHQYDRRLFYQMLDDEGCITELDQYDISSMTDCSIKSYH